MADRILTEDYPITLKAGDSGDIEINLPPIIPLTGREIQMTARWLDDSIIFQKQTTGGSITVTDLKILIHMLNADTAGKSGEGNYDIQKKLGTEFQTFMSGPIYILPEYERRII